jgi:hypothetical protein
MTTMRGTPTVPFSSLIADTIATHGMLWAWRYYSKHGMSRQEFRLWAKLAYRMGT